MSVTSTSTLSVQVLDFEDNCLLIQLSRLYVLPVRRASVLPAASFGFCLTTDTLAVQLTIPPAGVVGDFHPQMNAPCRAHVIKSLASLRGFVNCHVSFSSLISPEGSFS